jgi:glyoxylase-like metal-dependent hydrolase (beta-lactamase superfamily II)
MASPDRFKTWTTKSGYRIIKVLGGRSNVFLLTNGEKNILIDTSAAWFWKKLRRNLDVLGIDRLDYLVLTHTHFDHAGNALRIREKYGPKVAVHSTEAAFLESGKTMLPRGTNFFTKMLMHQSHRVADKFHVEPCKADILVGERLDLSEAGASFSILHTPGHTSGSMSMVVDGEIALVGDAMIGRFPGSVFPPFADDVPGLLRSWGKLLETGCRLFIPSHGSDNSRALVEQDYIKRIKYLS